MRIKDLLSEEKAAVPPKPRNFVAKNAKIGGAGQHKDKKKAEKQGDAKHKKDLATMESQGVAEGEQRMSRAAKGYEKYGKAGMTALAKAGRDGASDEKLDKIRDKHDKYDSKVDEVAGPEKCWPGHRKVGTKPGTGKNAGKRVNDCEKIGEAVEDRTSYQVAKVLHDHGIKYDPTREDELIKVIELALVKKLALDPRQVRGIMNDEDFLGDTFSELQHMEKGVSERVRDPEDWDEGNTEPGNNFAVYINGKKWKVLPGPAGAYADSPEEKRELARLQAMAQRKSQESGKKWQVYVTGESPTA